MRHLRFFFPMFLAFLSHPVFFYLTGGLEESVVCSFFLIPSSDNDFSTHLLKIKRQHLLIGANALQPNHSLAVYKMSTLVFDSFVSGQVDHHMTDSPKSLTSPILGLFTSTSSTVPRSHAEHCHLHKLLCYSRSLKKHDILWQNVLIIPAYELNPPC